MKPTQFLYYRSFFCTLFFMFAAGYGWGQTIIFSENMGNLSGNTNVNSYTGFENYGILTYTGTGGADVRKTDPSSGYSGASGDGNVLINTSAKSFQISGINTTNYTNLVLTFGQRKSRNDANNELIVEISSDGNNYTSLTYSRPTGSGTANWRLIEPTGTIPPTSNLRIRFRGINNTTDWRIDDVKLVGDLLSCTPPSDPTGSISGTTPACDSTVLSFSGSAPAGVTYYWQTSPSGTNTSNNAASLLTATASGIYYVRAKNNSDSCWSTGTSAGYSIIVNQSPVISTQPANKTVTEPAGTGFSVVAANASSYQWQLDDGSGWVNLTNTAPYGGVATASLNISSTTYAMNGYKFRVIVNGSAPCGNLTSNQATLTVNQVAGYFRTKQNGNWNATSTWESSVNGVSWSNATTVPGATAVSVKIRVGNKVTVTSSTNIANTEVESGGSLEVGNNDFVLIGAGYALTIKNGGSFIVNGSGKATTGTGLALVEAGGLFKAVSFSGSNDFVSNYLHLGGTSNKFRFADQSIFEWDSSNTMGSANFPEIFWVNNSGDLVIFKLTKTFSPSAFGSTKNDNLFHAVLEIPGDRTLTFQNGPEIIFEGGVIGNGKLTIIASSEKFVLGQNGSPEARLGNSGNLTLNVPSTTLQLENIQVPAAASVTIESGGAGNPNTFARTGGNININGLLDITDLRITNTAAGAIVVNNGGTLRTRFTGGIYGGGSAIVSGVLTLNNNSTVDYYATENQDISSAPNYYHIIFSGAGTKTPGGPIAVDTGGSVTITGTPTVDFSTKNLASTSSNATAFTMNGGRLILGTTGTLPNMQGTYNLSGGVVEFNNTSGTGQTIRTTPDYKYQNIEVTGETVGTSGGNVALRPNGSFIVKTDGIFTIRDRSIKCYNTIPGDLGAGTGCSVTVENNAVFQTGNSKGFSDYGSEFGSESSAVDANISNINLQNGSTVEYLGEKATGQIISRNTNVGQGTANYYNLTVSGDLVNKVEGLLEVNNVVEIKNHDTYTGKMVIKAVADNEAANVLIAKKGVITTGGELVFENNAQLMQDEDANNYGHIRVERQFTFSDIFKQYNFVSAPVTNSGTDIRSSIYYPAIPQSVQRYNEADYYFYETNAPYIPGKGYAVQEVEGTTDEIGQFTGTPNNGNSLSFTLKKSTAAGGFNLTGNPYPSNLNLNQLYTDNSDDIESTFYFWDNRGNTEFIQQGSEYNGDHYAKYNAPSGTGSAAAVGVSAPYETRIPTNEVKIGTGFMVQVKTGLDEGDYNLNFNNTQRITTNSGPGFFGKGQNFNQPQKDRYWLTMDTPGEIRVMNAVVYFDGGNDEFWLDDTKSFEGSDDLYTVNDGHKLTIQGRAPFRVNDVLPLGYKAFGTGTHIISVYQKEGIFAESQDIWLVDMLLNKTVNLSKKPYKFVTRAGEYGNRFKIVYRPSFQTGVDIHANDISMLKVGQQIEISSTIDRISEVEVFDLNSRPVFKKNEINHNKFIVNAISFNHQILNIKVKTETGETVTRKFVMK